MTAHPATATRAVARAPPREAARSAGGAAARSLGDADGLALLVGGQQHRRRPLVHRRDVRLLPVRRRARAADAHPARACPDNDFLSAELLQPGLHRARLGDDVSLRRSRSSRRSRSCSCRRCSARATCRSRGSRRSGSGLRCSAAFFLCGSIFFDAAPRGGWFMYPPLTSDYQPGHRRRHLAARLLVHRGRGDRRRGRADRRRAQVPAARACAST